MFKRRGNANNWWNEINPDNPKIKGLKKKLKSPFE